jgi:hypothetical protein
VPWDSQGAINALFGVTPFPLINNFFTVPLSALYTGYTFDPTAPGQQSFGGYVPTNPFGPGYDLPGTQDGPDGTYLMPWAGQTVNLTDVTSNAWNAYLAHLQADPAQNPIKIPTGQDIGRALTNLVASFVVSFDPFTPGMSYCPTCEWPTAITPEGIIGSLSAADPGNTLLRAWLDNHSWQASQGAPGSTATPSAPDSVEQQTAGRSEAKAALQSPAPTDTSPSPEQHRGRHAKPDSDPMAATDAASKTNVPSSDDAGRTSSRIPDSTGAPSGDGAGETRSFQHRINDAVARAIGGGEGDTPEPGGADKPADGSRPGDGHQSGDRNIPNGNGSGVHNRSGGAEHRSGGTNGSGDRHESGGTNHGSGDTDTSGSNGT